MIDVSLDYDNSGWQELRKYFISENQVAKLLHDGSNAIVTRLERLEEGKQ